LGKEVSGLSQTAMQNLTSYSWPGNVRELQNVIERAVVLAKGSIVQIDKWMLQAERPEQSSLETLENMERKHIIRALTETRWIIHGG
jgi:formate hydrogenlyase transcriptional activator